MYGLPENFDATIFVGREIVQVNFSSNTLHLVFDGDVSITLEGAYRYQSSSGDLQEHGRIPVSSSAVMQLAGHTVASASGERDGTLMLRFDDGQVFTCIDDTAAYESYRIRRGNGETIV